MKPKVSFNLMKLPRVTARVSILGITKFHFLKRPNNLEEHRGQGNLEEQN